MSRTFKDIPYRLVYEYKTNRVKYPKHEYFYDSEKDDIKLREYEYHFNRFEQKTKSRKYYHHMSTPSWWTRAVMNRPNRRAARVWERQVLFQDIELADPPGVSRKPHKYYW